MDHLSIRYLKGVGPKKEAIFNELSVHTVRDMLYYFPFRYEDRRNVRKITELKVNEPAVIKGKILAAKLSRIPRFANAKRIKSIFEIMLGDETGAVECMWFNQEYLARQLLAGEELMVYGKPTYKRNKLRIVFGQYYRPDKGDSLDVGRIVGIYSLAGSLTQKFIRKIVRGAFEQLRNSLADPIPFYIRKEKDIPNIMWSLEAMHFPNSWEDSQRSRERFIFEELFFSQILVYLRKAKHRLQEATSFTFDREMISVLRRNLDFTLTASQEEAIRQITSDTAQSYPMHRLLQGDVGCGKTVVAAFAIALCARSGLQAALMVPTEILVYQHKETLEKMFSGLGFRIEILTSSFAAKDAERIYEGLRSGAIDIVIGTHALIQKDVLFKRLGLAVIDEQHKFGVAQRMLLPKKGNNPHCLVMSATPIPRSLALSLYGDLDISIIRELPKGRLLPQTKWIKESQRAEIYRFIGQQLRQGRQAYIIYPVIEESEDEDLQSLETMYVNISRQFSDFSVDMFHGKLTAKQKQETIRKFREKKIHILVATTIVEVGVNIENATVMMVENPERFGLAQLHQLRGRIQRSTHQPYFILISADDISENASRRLKAISSTNDGFLIAEDDLRLRGPGDFFGELQHGLPNLKIANPLRDLEVLKQARLYAYRVIKNDHSLEKLEHRSIKDYLEVLTSAFQPQHAESVTN
ncbi:MAG: ATP-dependent DNA helicase RecG [Candidatus Omnitrophota bacterium]